MPFSVSADILIHAGSWNPIEDFNEDQASYKTADMGPESNASHIARGNTCRKQLDEKPVTEKDKSGNFDELEEEEDRDQRHDSGGRME